jgi:peptidyl-prolyl cis-trans isomerase B (cyclophilin B)
MKKKLIAIAGIIALMVVLVIIQDFVLGNQKASGIISSAANSGEKPAKNNPADKNKQTEVEGMEPLKSFTGSEYVNPANKIAIMETNMGTIKLKFFPEVAPIHVQSFIHLANKGFFNGLTFHRIIDGFVIQGGCPKGDGTGGPGYRIKAEFNNIKHQLGVLSMARSQEPDSGGSQFFICLGDLPKLDGKYTVFGTTIEGIDVVKAIGKVATDASDKPLKPVIIKSVKIVDVKK